LLILLVQGVPHNSFLDVEEGDLKAEGESEEDPDRGNVRGFLDKTQGELTYLMVAPSNPMPPRDSAPVEDIVQMQASNFGIPQNQPSLEEIYQQQSRQKNSTRETSLPRPSQTPNHHPPPVPVTSSLPIRNAEPPISRSLADQQPLPQTTPQEWSSNFQFPEQPAEDQVTKVNHSYDSYGRPIEIEETPIKDTQPDTDGWDFSETAQFPEPEKPVTQRPDTDLFPIAQDLPKSPNRGPGSHRRKGSMSRRKSGDQDLSLPQGQKVEGAFKVRFGLRGHLDAVRSVIFSGGGSPGEPEICTAGDDGIIKRWIIPGRYENQAGSHFGSGIDLDIQSYFTHRGHTGAVMCLTSWSPSQNFSSGGRAQGDGWIFSGGQDATVRVWERGRVDPKATLDGHTDAVWTVCVLPGTTGAVFGQSNPYGGPDRILVASGSADGTVKVWAVTAPPQLVSPQGGSRRGGRVRGNSMSSGSGFPSSPQPSVASNSPFSHTLVHSISRANSTASPTAITPLSASGEAFVVSYSDAAVLVYDTRTGEEVASMQSLETYDNTPATGVNAIVATTSGLDGSLSFDSGRGLSEDEGVVVGATGTSGSVEGIIISGHEDRYIRFYDANSGKFTTPGRSSDFTDSTDGPSTGQCTYNMLAHPAAISSLSLSPDGRELVSAGHDASLRFWSLEKRSCTQEITSHRLMRGEGVCSVVWSQDGRWVVSAGGDGVVKVFAR